MICRLVNEFELPPHRKFHQKDKQAGAELDQAQLKLELVFA